ncbi:PRKC apoptosis WT1 regulator protein-like isoform X2 [Schistocerca americana]|uniref:PRKC apoptosis WT1 regulator protein-like isoform X2 n=1 Tax=Schistocerca americana TaxID=7009 RepID=UPI001F4FEF4C|nr:PRKC apoptosis WT1 regulator protein-like isoform X2 [Schistocerca americana]XP_049783408.1 PRKC apoptosis WT1 regulator protein-like isoform X2 [Schistocerca cancellata]XP_049845684.1 PRKC apoptosis WT1 regulator protein-like isoform X2 [Schistocerca gregaria]XP_049953028.1 PRKC apoptosis WT1 regulator protein-like isoform X2 [Schistocerca serialis cubense]
MASSSVSQEDLENDFELSSRRSRIRTARARTVNPPARLGGGDVEDGGGGDGKTADSLNVSGSFPADHDASPKPLSRAKEKRINRCVPVRQPITEHVNRANHMNKGKQQQRDRRKLREKRRSTGVVHLPSTESTGGSTGEDEDEIQSVTAETRRNTQHNEHVDREPAEDRVTHKPFQQRRNKSFRFSPSDLEADDEDNQEFDSLNQSDSTVSSLVHASDSHSRQRPGTPTGDNPEELLERAQEENRRLLSLLEDRDRKITTLEARIAQIQRETALERDRLREENAALIRAMASLATAK